MPKKTKTPNLKAQSISRQKVRRGKLNEAMRQALASAIQNKRAKS